MAEVKGVLWTAKRTEAASRERTRRGETVHVP
jgi:hypothetical protein